MNFSSVSKSVCACVERRCVSMTPQHGNQNPSQGKQPRHLWDAGPHSAPNHDDACRARVDPISQLSMQVSWRITITETSMQVETSHRQNLKGVHSPPPQTHIVWNVLDIPYRATCKQESRTINPVYLIFIKHPFLDALALNTTTSIWH